MPTMKPRHLLACLLALPAGALALEQYRCPLVRERGNDRHEVDESQYVELLINDGNAHPRIHFDAANRDLRFRRCEPVRAPGSNFGSWFETVCRDFASVDGRGYYIDVYLYGGYAGLSPPILPGYALHDKLSRVGTAIGRGTPARTFVIYAEAKPVFEFFCYAETKATQP